jgi:hypothetical protein
MGPKGRARARSGIRRSGPRDRDWTVEIKRQGLTAPSDAAPDHNGESLELGQVQASGALRSPKLARTSEKGPTNSLVGFRPRDRDRGQENDRGKDSGGSG